jgi:predicted alpha/beta hydrolase family esterase
MKKQLILIHGGMVFETYEAYFKYLESYEIVLEKLNRKDWKDGLAQVLSDYEVIYPKMPNSKNARYLEWKLWFEKLFPFLHGEVVLVGHSLGGIFLAKYLSENNFPQKISSLHLVAAPYDDEYCPDEPLADFELGHTVEKIADKASKIFLYHSKDDTAVPFLDVEKYKRDLPNATVRIFEDRGHFNQETFSELVECVKES